MPADVVCVNCGAEADPADKMTGPLCAACLTARGMVPAAQAPPAKGKKKKTRKAGADGTTG